MATIIAADRRVIGPRTGDRHMTTTRRAGILTTGLATTAFLFAACGGGTASSAPTDGGAASQPPATDAAPSTEPTTTTASDAPDPSAIALPSFDLDDLVANLEGVDTYRLVVTADGEVAYEASVVTRPVLSRDISIDGGAQRFVIIGDEAWMGSGDDLQPAPAELAGGMLAAFDPMFIFGAFATPGALAGAEDIGIEEKNGVQARHFRLDSSTIVGTLASMPPGTSLDVWINEDPSYLVSMAVISDDGSFSFDIFDVNDPSITVERPS